MKRLLHSLTVILIPLQSISQSMNIPEGINYKEADEAIKNELKKPQYLNFDKIFYCDPQFVEKVYPNP